MSSTTTSGILLSALCLCLVMMVIQSASGYKVKHTTDPSYECSGCARTRMIGCFHGQCSYRCYRSCTNGTSIIIEAHRFVLEGERRRRKRWLGPDE